MKEGRVWKLLVLPVLVLALLTGFTGQVQAATPSDVQTLTLGTASSGTFSEYGQTAWYQFTLSTSGRVTISLTGSIEYAELSVYRSTDTSDYIEWEWCSADSATGSMSETITLDLMSGSYYVLVDNNDYESSYKLKVSFKTAGESFTESYSDRDDSFSAANTISLGSSYKGQIADVSYSSDEQDVDYYKFKLSKSGEVALTLTGDLKYLYCYIYDSGKNQIIDYVEAYSDATESVSIKEDIDLTSGTYYMVITAGYSDAGNYSFKTVFTSAGESFAETNGGDNNSINAADSVSLNKTYKGQIAENDDDDFYAFKVSKKTTVTITITSDMEIIEGYVYDSDGNKKLWIWNSVESGESNQAVDEVTLSKGTYYLAILGNNYTSFDDTGAYKFKISNKLYSVSVTNMTCTGKKVTPTVTVTNSYGTTLTEGTDYTVTYSSSSRKTIGKYTVKVKGKGQYSGTIKKTFKINPAKVKLTSSTKSTSKKKLTIAWKKVSGSPKYKIAYRLKGSSKWTTKTVSASTTSKTISGLKSGKKYEVRVMAYKKVDGTTYKGKWSSIKTVKVK